MTTLTIHHPPGQVAPAFGLDAAVQPQPAADAGPTPRPRVLRHLTDLVSGPWALLPAMLTQMQAIYTARLAGEAADIAGIEAALGRELDNSGAGGYQIDRGVAILPIQGVISPKANLMTQISGGASVQLLQRDFAAALAAPSVRAIVLYADTPGGSVMGSPDFAAQVHAARGTKPIVTWSDGMLASAGYWIGSAADAVYVSGAAVNVGSIGVVARHVNAGTADRVTEITAGRYKRMASDTAPLTAEGRAYLQEQVDYYYALFVDAVAAHRGVGVPQVLADMADGRIFIGQQGIDAGLVDGISTLDGLVHALATDPRSVTQRRVKPRALPRTAARSGAGAAASHPNPSTKGLAMSDQAAATSREDLERDHPEIIGAIRTDAHAAGASAERQRIQAVLALSQPGHEAMVQALAFDGRTTAGDAALQVLAAQRAAADAAGAAHFADAPSAAPAAAAPADEPVTKAQQVEKAKAYAKQHGCDFVAALKALGYAS